MLAPSVAVQGALHTLVETSMNDTYVRTQYFMQIAAMAPDTMEFCSLARKLALQLTDGLEDSTDATADDVDQVHLHTTAGTKGASERDLYLTAPLKLRTWFLFVAAQRRRMATC